MARTISVRIKKLDHFYNDGELKYATEFSSGIDLIASIETEISLKPLERKLIPTGIAIELPDEFEAQVRPRSGLALKNGITILNSPGTIDNDYRGEIKIILINLGQEEFKVLPGMKIAQLIFCRFDQADLIWVDELSDSVRSAGGFGSTGL